MPDADKRLAPILLIAAATVLYSGSFGHPLVFDDHGLLQQLGAPQPSPLRWLSDASFRGLRAAFGAEVLPQRVANALLHGATAAVLFGFLARLFAAVLVDVPADARARWLAFLAALWFVVHPVAVYGVAYLMQRSIILATLFSLLALWCVLEGLERRRARWYAAATAAYALALLSKEHAIMLPAVALALAVLLRGASRELLRRAAIGSAACAAIAVGVLAQRLSLIGATYEPYAAGILARLDIDPALAYPLSVENQASLFFRYLATWLVPWPGWISVDVRTLFPSQLFGWPYSAGFVAWLAYPVAAGWLLLRRGRAGLLGFGLLWPWLLALTEVAAVRVQEPFVLYRSYLWMSGLPAILPAVVAPIAPRWRIGAAAALCALLAAAAHERLQSFASPLALWDDAVRKNADPRAPYAERAYIARGLAQIDDGRLDAAGADFERALRLNPLAADAYVGRGIAGLRGARLEPALDDLDRAIALDPHLAPAYYHRCLVKTALGRGAQALADCDQAVALAPLSDGAWANRGVAYATLGRPSEAAASFERALEINPASGLAHHNYGVLLVNAGQRDAAARHFAAACQADIKAACGR